MSDYDATEFGGRVGVVTGASAGIGFATAAGFVRRGGQVLVCDLDGDAAKACADSFGPNAHPLQVDVGQRDEVDAMIDYAITTFGRLDFLHNNALGRPGPGRPYVHETPDEFWDYFLRVGLDSVFWGIRAAVRVMLEQGSGAIVSTASIAGNFSATLGNAGYGAAKAAIINLTRSAAQEYADRGIRINSISPGPVMTSRMVPLMANKPELRSEIEAHVPMGRLADPDEIANVVLFLASSKASFMTGENVVVDGGVSLASGLPQFK